MEAVVSGGFIRLGGAQWRCCLGRSGGQRHKPAGDEPTPAGRRPLRRGLLRADRGAAPRTAVPIEPIGRADGWCDDPADPAYNRPVQTPYAGRHEALWRSDGLYDLVGVLGWNDAPVRRGAGSAIFLHVARPDYAATAGCIALALPDLRAILAAGLTAVQVLGPG